MKTLAAVFAFGFALTACGPTPPGETNIRDVRVAIPDADPSFIDFVTPEQIIEPGQDAMFCTDIVYKGEETAFRDMKFLQGKFGHHVIVLATSKPKPEGTTYDCRSGASMADLQPFAIPTGAEFPQGYGSYLPTGTALVLQMHYVNTSSTPILVRDVVRLQKTPVANVQNWATAYATNDYGFKLPPGAIDVTSQFDCVIPQDLELLVLGGHMHENGASFKIEMGPNIQSLKTIYDVPAWEPEYRDTPPVNLFTTETLKVTKGTVFRTTCKWNNSTDREIEFPEEMCAAFASITGTRDPVTCFVGLTQK